MKECQGLFKNERMKGIPGGLLFFVCIIVVLM